MAYNYPYGNGQQLNLDWFLNEWKNLLAAWEAEKNGIDGALQAEIDRAEAALADVFAARDAAAQSAANALESKNAAAQSASDASGYLATVRADANTAHDAAQNAAQSESNAADSAQTALASKNAAGQSERNAAQSEANANSSKNAAAQSASDADASKSAAAQSAADADASKSAAAQSAEDAEAAANSVEASAQQITTNASDIENLKNIIVNPNAFPWIKPEYKKITMAGGGTVEKIGSVFRVNGARGSTQLIDLRELKTASYSELSSIILDRQIILRVRINGIITTTITGTQIYVNMFNAGTSTIIARIGDEFIFSNGEESTLCAETIVPAASIPQNCTIALQLRATVYDNLIVSVDLIPYNNAATALALSN